MATRNTDKKNKPKLLYGAVSLTDAPKMEQLEATNKQKKVPIVHSSSTMNSKLLMPVQALQLDLWNQLSDEEQGKIAKWELSAEWVNSRGEAIVLEPAEYKLIMCIRKLLYEKSTQNTDLKSPDYLTGNTNPNFHFPDGPDRTVIKFNNEKTASLHLGLYELTKEYKGGENFSGKDQSNVFTIASNLSEKREKFFLVKAQQTIETESGLFREKTVYSHQPLLTIYKIEDKNFRDAAKTKEISRSTEVVIILNPVWRKDIEQRFIKQPADIISRMIKANNDKHDISLSAYKLVDWLSEQFTLKNYVKEINLEEKDNREPGLLWIVAGNYMAAKKKGDAREWLRKSVEIAKGIGLLTETGFEIIKGAKGQDKARFILNKNWC